jgi:hypothetical protein
MNKHCDDGEFYGSEGICLKDDNTTDRSTSAFASSADFQILIYFARPKRGSKIFLNVFVNISKLMRIIFASTRDT